MSSHALEVALGNARFEFTKSTVFSLTGADCSAKLNGAALENWSAHQAHSGDVLELGFCRSGNIIYLAVKGGFQAEKILGSVSTVVRNQLGGLSGKGDAIAAGDSLTYAAREGVKTRRLSPKFIPSYDDSVEIKVIPGYQFELFESCELDVFFEAPYKLLPNSDRMGYRFSGAPIKSNVAGIVSEGIALGSVQLPSDGQPIVLMQDRQTIGGYPKLGCVRKTDIGKLAQTRFGHSVSFVKDTLEQACSEWNALNRFFQG